MALASPLISTQYVAVLSSNGLCPFVVGDELPEVSRCRRTPLCVWKPATKSLLLALLTCCVLLVPGVVMKQGLNGTNMRYSKVRLYRRCYAINYAKPLLESNLRQALQRMRHEYQRLPIFIYAAAKRVPDTVSESSHRLELISVVF